MRTATLAFLLPLAAWSQEPAEMFSLKYQELTVGTGAAAAPGQEYTVHYTGWLRDGSKFDSSRDRNEPFVFVQGRRQVIAGWEAGFEGMRMGGKRKLFIPYQMAYGEKGSGRIPPKAELIFEVELLSVKDVKEPMPAADVLTPLGELEQKVMALARSIPEEKYAWRPGPGVRSFGEVFLHIALGNELLLNVQAATAGKEQIRAQIEANAKAEKEILVRARIVERLQASFDAIKKTLEPMRAGALGRDIDFFGNTMTRHTVLVFVNTHIAEHLGQAIAYTRVNGLTPPWK